MSSTLSFTSIWDNPDSPVPKPSTCQEERETLEFLHRRAATLAEALAQRSSELPRDQAAQLQRALQHARQLHSGAASRHLEPLVTSEDFSRVSTEVREALNQLLQILTLAATLEQVAPLPPPWGQETPRGFFQRLEFQPQELMQLLLSPLDDGLSPEDNLLLVLGNLHKTLRPWRCAPALDYAQDNLPRYETYAKLLQLTKWLSKNLEDLGDDSQGYLKLLRWRLERVDDAVLPEAWRLSYWDSGFAPFRVVVKLLGLLQARIFTEGASTMSVATWDALVKYLFEILERFDEETLKLSPYRIRELSEDFEVLMKHVDPLAQLLVSLEQEGFADLPPELQATFMRGNLLTLLPPSLLRVLENA